MEGIVHALSDCERVRPGLLGQPMNAASSLAFVAAGLWLLSRSSDGDGNLRLYAAALGVLGLGSFAYHGPGGGVARWGHDVGVALPAVVLGVAAVARRRPTTRVWPLLAGAVTVVAGALAVRPSWSVVIATAVIAATAAAELGAWRGDRRLHRRRRAAAGGVGLLAAGAVVDVFSRTDAAWCRPDSLLQGHAAWHVAAAVGLALYGRAALATWSDAARTSPSQR